LDTSRTFASHHFVVTRFSSNDGAESNNRVNATGGTNQGIGEEWYLKRTGHPHDTDVTSTDA